jgi:hypothetical protein
VDDDPPPITHVYPLFGRAHVLDLEEGECWCQPTPDPECPSVLIHNAEQ